MTKRKTPRPGARRDSSGIVLGAGVIVHVMFLLSLVSGFLNPLFDDATHRIGRGADFYAVYQAGENFVAGISVYEKPLVKVVPYLYPYRYLPFTAYTFGQIFRLFNPEQAYWCWIIALEAMLFGNLLLTKKLIANPKHQRIGMALWLLFTPYYLELYMGQFSFFMATLLFWTIYYWSRKKNLWGDALWTFSLLVKTNSAVFTPVMLKERRWKPVVVALIVIAVVSIPYFLTVQGSFKAFGWNFTEGLSVETISGNQGFLAMLAVSILRITGHWMEPIQQFFKNLDAMNDVVRLPLMIWTGMVVGVSVWTTFRASRKHTTELFILWILTYFLVYKHVWEHHYVMLMPVIVLLYVGMQRKDGIKFSPVVFWITTVIIALPTLFIFIDKTNIYLDPEFFWPASEQFLFHLPKPAATLLLYISLAVPLWKSRQLAHPEKQKLPLREETEAS